MVKADPSRNYYLDLGIAATADENEVRRAFRALALKWHPDRNPGREAEFVAKFQQIQAAHEILSDPVQRAKYDADRRKYRNINIPAQNPNTPRARPPPRYEPTTTTPSGSYYRPPPPKPTPTRPPPPQQHHSSYASGADRFTSRNFRAPPTAQRQDARAKDAEARANVFTAWQKMKQPRPEEARTSHAGNANNPNGAPFGRSQSTRVPSSRKGFDLFHGADEGQARSSYRSNYERPAPSPPHATDPMKDKEDEVPFSEANRTRTPYFSSKSGERTSMFEGLGRSASVRNSPTHSHRATSSVDAGSFSDGGHQRARNSYAGKSSNPFPQMYSSSSEDEFEAEVFQKGTKHQGPPPPQAPPTNQQSTWGQRIFGEQNEGSYGKPESTPNKFKSKSEESINMKFSPSDWHGKFQGTPDYLTANMQNGTTNKGRTSPTRGRQPQKANWANPFTGQTPIPPPASNPWSQQQQHSQMPTPPPPPPGPPPAPSNPHNPFQTQPPAVPAPHATKFSPQAWTNTFKEPSWVFQPPPKETSPRRGSEQTKRPGKAQRKASQSAKTNSETQPAKPKPKYQAFAEEAGGDVEPMDIDSNTPPMGKTNPAASRSRAGPPPSQAKKGAVKLPNGTTTASPTGSQSKTQGTASATKAPAAGLNGLAGLSTVEPFLPSANGGLTGLTDLKDTLPFKSQASSSHPTKPNTAQKLKIPTVPQAPQPPAKLDLVSAEQYFTHMEHYVYKFREYSKNMSAHFSGRCSELDELDDRFIHNRGEGTKKLGFPSYLHKMKEDEKVMEAWKYAQELHIQAMEKCEEIRNKSMKLYPSQA